MHAEQRTATTTASRDLPFADGDYLVIPRQLVDAMPDDWRTAAGALLSELARGFTDVAEPGTYKVEPCDVVELSELDYPQLQSLGLTVSLGCLKPDHFHCMEGTEDACEPGKVYIDGDGHELPPSTRVRVPIADPGAGHTTVTPQLELPPHDQAALVRHLQQAGDIAAYLESLVAAARDAAAKGHVDRQLATAVIQLAPTVRDTVSGWQSLVEVASGL